MTTKPEGYPQKRIRRFALTDKQQKKEPQKVVGVSKEKPKKK